MNLSFRYGAPGCFYVGKNIGNNIITGSQHTHTEETFASVIRNQLGP